MRASMHRNREGVQQQKTIVNVEDRGCDTKQRMLISYRQCLIQSDS